MDLYINTAEYGEAVFAISRDGKIFKKKYKLKAHESFKAVVKLNEFFKTYRVDKTLIQKIFVNKGPGSYVGVRVGTTLAMALSMVLGVRVIALAKPEIEKAVNGLL